MKPTRLRNQLNVIKKLHSALSTEQERWCDLLRKRNEAEDYAHAVKATNCAWQAEVTALRTALGAEQDRRSDVIRERNEAEERARVAEAANRVLQAEVTQLRLDELTRLHEDLGGYADPAPTDPKEPNRRA